MMLIEALCDVPERTQEWVWNDVIPVGQLTLLMGEPGVGKSLFAMDAIARLTRGVCGHCESDRGAVGAAMLFVGEDDVGCTVRTRLNAAGADLSLVSLAGNLISVNPQTRRLSRMLIRESCDLEELEAYLQDIKKSGDPVRLIVIDPVNCFLEDADKKGTEGFRSMIAALGDLALAWDLAILMVAQADRIGKGSEATLRSTVPVLTAVARSVWKIVLDDVDPRVRLLLPVKTNLCETPPGFRFTIEQQVIHWDDRPVEGSANDSTEKFDWERFPDEMTRVTEWLRYRLREGAVLTTTLRKEAASLRMSGATMRRALTQLGCLRGKQLGLNGKWFWELPGPTLTNGKRQVDRILESRVDFLGQRSDDLLQTRLDQDVQSCSS
jgi:putative DNA primase/helicase